jgi:hypothetical protein
MMKRQYLRILIALVGFASLGMSAKAQARDQLVVKIPFDFVAAGKTLPAGTYRVNRLSIDDRWGAGLIVRNLKNSESAIVHPTQVESDYGLDNWFGPDEAEKGRATFEQAGDQHFLSRIETGEHVFTIPVSREAILEASAKSHSGSASGSSSGSN